MENNHKFNFFKINRNKNTTSQQLLATSGVIIIFLSFFLKTISSISKGLPPLINTMSIIGIVIGVLFFILSFIPTRKTKKSSNNKACKDDACSSHNATMPNVCNYCGSKLDKNQSVCSQCGYAQEIKCKKCGYINSSSNTYCTNCDNKLD